MATMIVILVIGLLVDASSSAGSSGSCCAAAASLPTRNRWERCGGPRRTKTLAVAPAG